MDQRSRTPSDSDLAKSPGITKADLPERFKLDLASLQCQDDYLRSVFELLKETSLLAVLLVHGIPVTPFSRNEAIRRGLLKRLTLLGKSLLCDISQNSAYQQEQLSRQIVETAANYFYLSADEGSGERYDSYVLNSLAEEKASLAIIAGQIKKRGGDPEPIEKRMRRSIERMAIAAGVDFDAVPGKSKSGWPSAMDRLGVLSPVAYTPYRTGSNALHSGWSVLLLRDIEPGGGRLLVREYDPPRGAANECRLPDDR